MFFMSEDVFKKAIIAVLMNTPAKALGKEKIASLIEVPSNRQFGDYAFPCFQLSKELKKNPNEIALLLEKQLKPPSIIERTLAVGSYINFFIKKEKLSGQVISKTLKQKNSYGSSKQGKGKTVMIEYSQPNTNKPLHIGHLRNIALAMSLSKILEFNGFRAIKANLYNDRGIHICKSMLAYKKWGKGKTPDEKPDHFVGKFYVMYSQNETEEMKTELQEMLRKWEQGEKQTISLWKKMNQWTIKGFKETYKRFGNRFDVEYYESKLYDKAMPMIKKGLEKRVFQKEADGAVICDMEKYGLGKKTVLRADGTAIYLTQDLALAVQKFKDYKLHESLYVVGSEQNFYFRQLFKIFELLELPFAEKSRHVSYELVLLPEGKLKSREGKVVDADDLMDEMESLAEKELKARYTLSEKELSRRKRAIALAAIKFFMLKQENRKSILFVPEQAISFEGDSGPYLQYTFARANSILKKSKQKMSKIDFSLLKEDLEKEIISLLKEFQEKASDSAQNHSPHIIVHYLLSLANKFNSFYHQFPVIQAETKELARARHALVQAVAQTMKNGLHLLGIEALEEM